MHLPHGSNVERFVVQSQQKGQIELNGEQDATPDGDETKRRDEREMNMAYANEIRTGAANAGFLSNLVSILGDRVAKYKIYRSTVVELEMLTDRELADLGVSRSMIKGIAIEAAYGA